MATARTFGKPCLAGMPPEYGRRIIKHILETPPPDFERLDREVDEWEQKVLAEREKRKNGGN